MEDSFAFYLMPKASKDLEEIYLYITNILKNPVAADNLMKEFYKVFNNLLDFPFMYPVIENKFIQNKNLRKIAVNSYLVFYRVKEKKIEIVRVLSGLLDYQYLL
jgi:plasmid stabilization system protein ParE